LSINIDELLGKRWVYGEDTATGQVFRPRTGKTRSRPRFSFELKADGTAVRYDIGITDRFQPSAATWRLEGDSLVISSESEQKPDLVFKILSAAPDRLEVEK
jgi:hypothetical protein